jgi:crotonobetainyl-CoA:carnitine CoA-transferase CaiB-like acyl-CoA transferase
VWVAISTSAESVAQRVLALIGADDDERFATNASRMEHRDELDALVSEWIGARASADVLDQFEAAQAAIAPVYTMEDVFADAHVRERKAIIEVDGVRMPGPVARLSRTPGEVRHAGRPLGADTDDVLAELPDRGEDPGPGRDTSRGGSA